MPLSKQSVFRVLTRSEVFDGTDTRTEVVLLEQDIDPSATPVVVTFRDLSPADADVFRTGARITMTIGADVAPAQAVAEPTLTQKALGLFGLGKS